VRSKADKSAQSTVKNPTTKKWRKEKLKVKTDVLRNIGKQSGESVDSVLLKLDQHQYVAPQTSTRRTAIEHCVRMLASMTLLTS